MLSAFVTVAQTGSFTKAAAQLGSHKAHISRSLATLERELGVRLLERTTRRVRLTDIGERIFSQASGVLTGVADIESTAADVQGEPKGALRLSAGSEFGPIGLTRWLAVFTEQFPKVTVEIDAATGSGPLVPEGIDLSLRLGNIEDPTVTVRKLGDLSYGLFASAKYLERKGTPQDGEDLRKHVLLMSAGGPHRTGWQLVTLSRQSRIEGPARLRAADSVMLRDAACGGLGIALLPVAIGKEEVTRGTLKRVLSAWSGPKLPVQAVYPAARPASAKVRAFIEVAAALPPL